MTTQEKLTKIESMIREMCPELVGCTKSLYACGRIPCKNVDHFSEIHLHHILRAIDMQRQKPIWVSIGQNGQFKIMELHTGDEKIVSERYNLTLPLHLQSDELISWLYGVLVGE